MAGEQSAERVRTRFGPSFSLRRVCVPPSPTTPITARADDPAAPLSLASLLPDKLPLTESFEAATDFEPSSFLDLPFASAAISNRSPSMPNCGFGF